MNRHQQTMASEQQYSHVYQNSEEYTRGESRVAQLGQPLGIWLGLCLLTSLWLAVASTLFPRTLIEQAVPIWPPAPLSGAWLERSILAPWNRWDVFFYLQIVQEGYRPDNGTAQFHPLLSWLAILVTRIGGSPLFSLMLVSSGASALLFVVFERLARLDLSHDKVRISTLLLACSPITFILFAPYTESLFLLWAVLCLLWARQQSWWLAGLAGALATLTRQQGLFLFLPLAWELWEASGRNWRQALGAWRNWLALGLIPTGMLVWLVYRAIVLNDFQADFSHPQALIYSLLISPSANKVVPQQAFLFPWHALWLALTHLWFSFDYRAAIDLVLGSGFIFLLVLGWRQMRISYRIFAVTITLVSFSYHTGMDYPYMGLARHLLLAFPVFIGVGAVLNQHWLRIAVYAGGVSCMFFLLLLYSLQVWVP